MAVATSLSGPTVIPAGAFYSGAALYLLLSNQLHYRVIQFSGSEWILSTPFDASLLTPEPPHGGSFFVMACTISAVRPPLRCGLANPRPGGQAQLPLAARGPTDPRPPARPRLSTRFAAV